MPYDYEPISPKQIRGLMGVNIKEMCTLMGVTRGTYNKWERFDNIMTAAPKRLLHTLLWLHEMGLLKSFRDRFPDPS